MHTCGAAHFECVDSEDMNVNVWVIYNEGKVMHFDGGDIGFDNSNLNFNTPHSHLAFFPLAIFTCGTYMLDNLPPL